MFEDNAYEPIAEIYLTLSDQIHLDDIYCLCSRVFVDGVNDREVDVQEEGDGEVEVSEDAEKKICSESVVRFCNSSTESPPVPTPKKTHEETVSCYCSASHYSTDEHDSLRDTDHTLHHSDSGADLSESSRDLDWERYWTLNGERLIWESWISKYGTYIDPNYLSQSTHIDSIPVQTGNTNNTSDCAQLPAEGDEASFCVQGDRFPDPNRRTSFTGFLDVVKTDKISRDSVDSQDSFIEETSEVKAPQILVQSAKSEEDLLNRRLSDLSETAKSVSGRSEDSLNFDENDKLRLSVFSRCSGNSAPLSATTDSMTNVTRITLSSSDSSCNIDESSAKSSSILSSSDSGSSVDQQWQVLWAEHFNQQYYYHFNRFTEKHNKKRDTSEDVKSEVRSDSGFIVDNSKLSTNQHEHSEPQHQESIDDVGSIETQDSVSEGEQSKPPSLTSKSSKSSSKSDRSKTYIQKQRLLSVGYLLQQLNAMSVESSERIQEEDENSSLSRPSTMESMKIVDANKSEQCDSGEACVTGEENPIGGDCCRMASDGLDSDNANVCDMEAKSCDSEEVLDEELSEGLDEESAGVRHGIKRSHEQECDESSVDKVKSAYQLMGLMYDLKDTKKIRRASVWYKKRFSQIRFQNRILRLQKPPNKHIHFDDDDDNCDETPSQVKVDDNQDKTDSVEVFLDAADSSFPEIEEESSTQRKLEMEDFSEKDDSTDDDQDIFFSAEEDNIIDPNKKKHDNKFKLIPKRRKKRQLKKKSLVNYPEEMVENPQIKKYWHRRYSLFSKFDEGIKMDAESWYSVTPEKIAINIADRCRCDLVVDAFCGAGGNAIQLAFTCERVIAIDIDAQKIELARHNAKVYGVDDRIEFIVGDYLKLAPTLTADVVFLSPPWGGPGYNKRTVFPLSSILPVAGQELFETTANITENIAFYLPKNINTHELVECAGPGGYVEVVQNFLDRELIAITAYFGELVNCVE